MGASSSRPAGTVTVVKYLEPRPFRGGEFIEASACRSNPSARCPASPPPWGRVHRGVNPASRPARRAGLAPSVGASSSRLGTCCPYSSLWYASLAPSVGASSSRPVDASGLEHRRGGLAPSVGASSSRQGLSCLLFPGWRRLAPSVGASSSRRPTVRAGRSTPARPRPLRGGEFIEACTRSRAPAPAVRASPPPWGRVHRGLTSCPCDSGDVSASPPPWGRVHRGYMRSPSVKSSHGLAPSVGASSSRLERGGHSRAGTGGRLAPSVGASSSRLLFRDVRAGRFQASPPPWGEFIEARSLPTTATTTYLPRPLRGGEFIEARRPERRSVRLAASPPPWGPSSSRLQRVAPSGCGQLRRLAPSVGASSSRLEYRDRLSLLVVRASPPPWGRDHRGNTGHDTALGARPRPLRGGEFIEASIYLDAPAATLGLAPPSGCRTTVEWQRLRRAR